MLRRRSRRAFRLVRVGVLGSNLNVFTGVGDMGASRTRACARTGARGSWRAAGETLRRGAFPLLVGLALVLTARLALGWFS